MTAGNVTDEIKAKLDIVQIISEYLTLKKAGTRFVGLCPFHHERTPSFSVSPDMGFWYCFGCSEGGDVFSFVERIEGMDFAGTLRLLAEKAGVELKYEDSGKRSERQRLLDANLLTAKFFHEVLLRSPRAEHARAYLKERGLSERTIQDFLLGYAPDSWEVTTGFLKKRGYTDGELQKAGLAMRSNRGQGLYDRFRDRIMFPIRDVHGNVVAFTGRILPKSDSREQKEAKYVNTQQTPVYDKSSVVFGLDRARQAIRKEKVAVVVEGNMDVISSHQAGVTHVVATSGTAFTEEQLTLLKRFADRLILSFDQDAAGEKAARRGIDLAVGAGFSVRILRLPEGAGKDPDDCIRKDPTLWKKAIASAVPYMEWYISCARERTDMRDPDAKRDASVEIFSEIAKISSPVERTHWIREVADVFETPEEMIFEQVESMRQVRQGGIYKNNGETSEKKTTATPLPTRVSRDVAIAEHLIGAALVWPEITEIVISKLDSSNLGGIFGELYKDLKVGYTALCTREDGSVTDFLHTFHKDRSHDTAKACARARLRAEEAFSTLSMDERKEEVMRLIGELESLHKIRRKHELAQAMAKAEKAGDMERIKEITKQLQELF